MVFTLSEADALESVQNMQAPAQIDVLAIITGDDSWFCFEKYLIVSQQTVLIFLTRCTKNAIKCEEKLPNVSVGAIYSGQNQKP